MPYFIIMASIIATLKDRWARFRRWQVRPYVDPPINPDESTICLNCGDAYTGNYCPRCGQTKSTRRFTLRNAVVNFFEVWGLTNSAFIRTATHLLLRPGRMIGDYLRGHRQPYFPPIRMLFIIVAIFIIVDYFLPQFAASPESVSGTQENSKSVIAMMNMVDMIEKWMKEHVAATLIMMHSLMALITTRIFRNSPRLLRSTIVENFYAQVYICCQMLILGFVSMLFTFPFFYHEVSEINEIAGLAVYVIDYKQLYGMKWWSTIWRTVVCSALMIATIVLILIVVMLIYGVRVAIAQGGFS